MKIVLFAVTIFLSFGMISGCGGPKKSRQEQLEISQALADASTKEYKGFTKEQIANAVTQVLTLIDPTDAKFIHTKNKISMTRYYTAFLIFNAVHGYDFWIINLDSLNENTTTVSIAVANTSNMGMFASVPSSSIPHVTIENSVLSEGEAKLFFKRVDYILGIENQWITCKEALAFAHENNYHTNYYTKDGKLDGHFPYICGDNRFGVEDKHPDYLKNR